MRCYSRKGRSRSSRRFDALNFSQCPGESDFQIFGNKKTLAQAKRQARTKSDHPSRQQRHWRTWTTQVNKDCTAPKSRSPLGTATRGTVTIFYSVDCIVPWTDFILFDCIVPCTKLRSSLREKEFLASRCEITYMWWVWKLGRFQNNRLIKVCVVCN